MWHGVGFVAWGGCAKYYFVNLSLFVPSFGELANGHQRDL